MLRLNDVGADVRLWQKFVISQGFALPQFGPDGQFGSETAEATRAFQSRVGLPLNGLLDERTLDAAETLGFLPQDHDARPVPSDPATHSLAFPPRPDDLEAPTVPQQQDRFGPLILRMADDREHPERIVITNRFEEEKLVTVRVPQLADMVGAPASLTISWSRLAYRSCSGCGRPGRRQGCSTGSRPGRVRSSRAASAAAPATLATTPLARRSISTTPGTNWARCRRWSTFAARSVSSYRSPTGSASSGAGITCIGSTAIISRPDG